MEKECVAGGEGVNCCCCCFNAAALWLLQLVVMVANVWRCRKEAEKEVRSEGVGERKKKWRSRKCRWRNRRGVKVLLVVVGVGAGDGECLALQKGRKKEIKSEGVGEREKKWRSGERKRCWIKRREGAKVLQPSCCCTWFGVAERKKERSREERGSVKVSLEKM